MPPSASDIGDDEVHALERALAHLKTFRERAGTDDDGTGDANAHSKVVQELTAENDALRRELHSLRARSNDDVGKPSSTTTMTVSFADDPASTSMYRSSSAEALSASASEGRRLAGFRTKSHKFVVRDCSSGALNQVTGVGSTKRLVDGDEDSLAHESELDDDHEYKSDPCSHAREVKTETRAFAAAVDDADVDSPRVSASRTQLKAAFELVLANDEGVDVLAPEDRKIRTRQKGLPHSKFSWLEPPRNALIVKKIHDSAATEMMRRAIDVLKANKVTSWLESAVWEEFMDLQKDCKTWNENDETFRVDEVIDFIVVLGGDGTILWASKYFPKAMPPVVPFAMGSLGFLTSHRIEDMEKTLSDVCLGDFAISMRSRLVAKVVTAEGVHSKWRYVLNEVLIDRGPKPVMVELNIGVDGYHVTKVAADGVILSSPTGSTAYSLAAGGSMVHPGVPAMLVTPICPHTLSFRPVVLPDSVVVTISCPTQARNTAWAAFDGKHQTELKRGDSVVVRVAGFPVPSVCNASENNDWFAAVKQGLLWNARGADQKPFDEHAQ